MKKIVTFGEIMLRLQPSGFKRFEQATSFDAVYGGGEANVSVSLANFGMDACFVSKLPDNPLGQAAVNELRKFGVDTSNIVRGGERIGIYFAEKGASQRPSKVVYDRNHSSIMGSLPEEYDWKKIFAGADWFHFTGITPALGQACAAAALEACKTARAMGIVVSCDLNYRKNLWTPQQAGVVMEKIMPYVDVCIANEEDAEKVFGIKADDTDVSGGKISHDGYVDVAKKLTERFGFKAVAITLRGSISASVNNWAGMLYTDGQASFSNEYNIMIVDRIGGGDSFAAGLIYALLEKYPAKAAINFAIAASCLKHSIEGDANHVSVAEVLTLANGDGSGRVQR
ncbi:MAG: sugar kinase [Negativicutes bacterium]|jgi:2-dehydro-3-deoxygluconokinase